MKTDWNFQSFFAGENDQHVFEFRQSLKLLQQPGNVLVGVSQRRGSGRDYEGVSRDAQLRTALRLALWPEHVRVDSRRNDSSPAVGSDDRTTLGQIRQPLAVGNKLNVSTSIGLRFSALLVPCQNLIQRRLQDRTWRAGLDKTIAPAIKKTAAGEMPHIVQSNNHTYPAWQCLQPTGNIEPICNRV